MKKCRACCEEKPILDFPKHGGFSDGYNIDCKKCYLVKRKIYLKTALHVELESKACRMCGKEKKITEFWKTKLFVGGREARCKDCQNSIRKQPKQIESAKNTRKRWEEKNKQRVRAYNKMYREKNKDQIQRKEKKYKKENKGRLRERRLIYYKKNRDLILDKKRLAHEKNKDKERVYANKRNKERRKSDSMYKMKCYLKSRVWYIFKKNKYKKEKTSDLLGCSYEFARKWLENSFKKGMTWENMGEWHIDHKIPLSSARTKEELSHLFHYTNLQALWEKDNLKKSNKIIPIQLSILL